MADDPYDSFPGEAHQERSWRFWEHLVGLYRALVRLVELDPCPPGEVEVSSRLEPGDIILGGEGERSWASWWGLGGVSRTHSSSSPRQVRTQLAQLRRRLSHQVLVAADPPGEHGRRRFGTQTSSYLGSWSWATLRGFHRLVLWSWQRFSLDAPMLHLMLAVWAVSMATTGFPGILLRGNRDGGRA